jgi:membrane fusion protein (multidrug efflux system)
MAAWPALGAGSGSAFALLPAQNASGNWIKIVQRVPVRILLDPQELKSHPLRIGLSAHVRVDCAKRRGRQSVRDRAAQHGAAGAGQRRG